MKNLNKITFWAFWLLIISNAVLAQKTSLDLFAEFRKAGDGPPNGIRLNDSLFIDQTEVANIHWLEFLVANPDIACEMYPEIEVWDNYVFDDGFSELSKVIDAPCHPETWEKGDMYFRYPGFRFYPVVGINTEQVMEFCKWRSKVVNQNLNKEIQTNKRYKNLRDYECTFTFRLPTESEWEYAATAGKYNPDNPNNIYSYDNKKIRKN